MTKRRNTYFLLTIAAFIFAFGYFPNAVEIIYSQHIYPVISGLQRLISSVFPFAIGDFLYVLLICSVIYRLIKFILRNRKTQENYKQLTLASFNTFLLVYIAFKLLWGLNYARPRINETLKISAKAYTKAELLKLSAFFQGKLIDVNTSAQKNYTTAELKEIASTAYYKLSKSQAFFTYKFPSVKPVASTWLVSKTGIEGYYNPLSGEANINQILPEFVLPFVTCHEIAHQIGVAKEDEANLVGYLTAVSSDNKQFQFSANYNMFRYVLFEIRMKYPEDYNQIIAQIPPFILDKFKAEREFWARYNGAMSVYMGKTFDKILKLNNQQKGIKSYQDIVLWLVNYHKKDL